MGSLPMKLIASASYGINFAKLAVALFNRRPKPTDASLSKLAALQTVRKR